MKKLDLLFVRTAIDMAIEKAFKTLPSEVAKEYKSAIEKNEYESINYYYMNGNDGTAFDVECNDRLCEFMVFYNTEYGCAKCFVERNGNIEVYVYDLKDTQKRLIVDTSTFDSSIFRRLEKKVSEKFDTNNLYDVVIENWDLD